MGLITIIIIASLALIIFGFVYNAKSKSKKQRKQLLSTIENHAIVNNIKWDIIDVSFHRGLAWNAASRQFLYVDDSERNKQTMLIDMNEIGGCQLHKATNITHNTKKQPDLEDISRVELQLFYKDRTLEPVAFCFYNLIEDGLFEKPAAIQKAEYWKVLISQ